MTYTIDIYGGDHAEVPSVKLPFVPKKGQFIQYFHNNESYSGKIIQVTILTVEGNFVGFDIEIDTNE